MIAEPQARVWFLISCTTSAGMFLVITVASCTSVETFHRIYDLVAEVLSLSNSSLLLRDSPGLGHFICYALLSLSVTIVFSRWRNFMGPVVALGFGVLMEGVQTFIPSRDASLLDIGINFLGVSLGFGVYWLWVYFASDTNKPAKLVM